MGYVQGIKWNNELIKAKIYEVMGVLEIKRMPSASETELVLQNSSLSNKIAKTGGFYSWAKRLKLEIKHTETSTGKEYESKLSWYLIDKGYEVKQMSVKHPYDLLVNESIKIDVKAARRYYYNNKGYMYSFNMEKVDASCDLYVCYCINDLDLIEKVLVIPGRDIKSTQLSIGKNTVYEKYVNRWDLLEQYDKFYKQLA